MGEPVLLGPVIDESEPFRAEAPVEPEGVVGRVDPGDKHSGGEVDKQIERESLDEDRYYSGRGR